MDKFLLERQVIDLIKSVLYKKQPKLFAEIDADSLFEFAKKQKLASILYYAISQLPLEGDQKNKWSAYHYKSVMTDVSQQSEKDKLINLFTNEKIDTLSIKGFSIKALYSQSDMREMGDIDFLLKNSFDSAKEIMKNQGYSVDKYEDEAHDTYIKPPVLYVELHKKMVSNKFKTADYYSNIWDKAKKDANNEHSYYLNEEDTFIYHIVHFANHYYARGCGIRFVLDHFMFMKHFDKMDMDYIKGELQKLELLDFCNRINDIANKWFDENGEAVEFSRDETIIFRSGIYGNEETLKQTKINALEDKYKSRRFAKFMFFMGRVFPDIKTMGLWFPAVKKAPILYPIFWIYRFFRIFLFGRKGLKKEMEIIENDD